jgi:steroid 5-alpha reductase family enzyme
MNNFLTWLGFGTDTPNTTSFWHSPLVLVCTGTMFITSLIRVLHPKKNASIVDTIWHCLFGTAAAAGFMIGLSGQLPHNVIRSILLLIAIRGIIKIWELNRRV